MDCSSRLTTESENTRFNWYAYADISRWTSLHRAVGLIAVFNLFYFTLFCQWQQLNFLGCVPLSILVTQSNYFTWSLHIHAKLGSKNDSTEMPKDGLFNFSCYPFFISFISNQIYLDDQLIGEFPFSTYLPTHIYFNFQLVSFNTKLPSHRGVIDFMTMGFACSDNFASLDICFDSVFTFLNVYSPNYVCQAMSYIFILKLVEWKWKCVCSLYLLITIINNKANWTGLVLSAWVYVRPQNLTHPSGWFHCICCRCL